MINKFNIFASSSYARAVMPENAGLFLCPQDTRHYPYRGVPKGAQSPCKGLDTVKGNAVFYYLFLNLLSMSKTLQSASAQILAIAKVNHSDNRSKLINDLLDRYLNYCNIKEI